MSCSRPGDWNCRTCQHLNFQRRDSCQRCGEARPGGGSSLFGAVFTTGPDVRPGDWYCNCGAHNFASRSSCFKCGVSKDDSASFDTSSRIRGFAFGGGGGGGGIGSSSSRSGWKSGDWICTRFGCNQHNFASRTECFGCNAPRDASAGSKSSY